MPAVARLHHPVPNADVAQLAEQAIRNRQVGSSMLPVGTNQRNAPLAELAYAPVSSTGFSPFESGAAYHQEGWQSLAYCVGLENRRV